jgi:soluble lytic murein transglycosylase-like protein
MIKRVAISIAILLTMLALCPRPARAQIAFYTDSDGKRVYINANPQPAPKHSATAARSSRSTALAGPSVAESTTSSAEPSGATPPASPSVLGDSTATAVSTNDASPSDPATPSTPRADKPSLDQMVDDVAKRHNVDPQLVRAMIGVESNWDPNAVSRTGAQGLMQLEPSTARLMGVRSAFDPQQNLEGGVAYLRMLLERYGGDLDKALAAYNAGPGAVDRAGGVPHYTETENYVQRVTGTYNRPGSDRSAHSAIQASRPIYRSVDGSGRVVFTNE